MATPARISKAVVSAVVSPIQRFMALEVASGMLLLVVAILSIIWANSPFKELYQAIIHLPITLRIGNIVLDHPLHYWVNDALMVIFFFVVGLEIKREIVHGELSSPKRAALPLVAAVGGMIVPAIIYAFFNVPGPAAKGWGIPMATDIAFAVGVVALMSRKVPYALKIFLLALAIVDDLGAVLVIAFFYTADLHSQAIALAFATAMIILFFRSAGVNSYIPYIIGGIFFWFFVLQSGVHATIAGVILGLMTPASPLSPEHTQTPLEEIVHALHPFVTYVIMPVFAFCNAGVEISTIGSFSQMISHPVFLGVSLGLLIGKPIGIFTACWVSVKLRFAELPRAVNWLQILSMGIVGGVGFTMALFVDELSLGGTEYEVFSKVGILLGSAAAAILGLALLSTFKDVEN